MKILLAFPWRKGENKGKKEYIGGGEDGERRGGDVVGGGGGVREREEVRRNGERVRISKRKKK